MNPLSNPDELKAKLAAIEAEFIGWLPLEGELTYMWARRMKQRC